MKTWQEIKDEYSREQGYDDFEDLVYSISKWEDDDLTKHIDAVSLLRAKQALDNAGHSAARAAMKERNLSLVYAKMYEAIKNEENIPL